MKAGIVVALPQELKTLTAERIRIGQTIKLGDWAIVALSGVGARYAEKAADKLVGHGISRLISWGTAGALDASLRSGDLILPSKVRAYEGIDYACDVQFIGALSDAVESRLELCRGPIVEARDMVDSPAAKAELAASTDARAVDMESAAIAKVAHRENIPFAAVRAVADEAHVTLPSAILAGAGPDGRFYLGRFLLHAALRPQQWRAIAAISHAFEAASTSLKIVASVLPGALVVAKDSRPE